MEEVVNELSQRNTEIQYTPTTKSVDSLWVEFVKRAVHAHGDVQVLQPSVLTDLIHHGRHSGSADLSGAAGHGPAHLLDDNTVVAGAVQPQLLQDGPDLQQRQTVTVGEGSEVRQWERHQIPYSCSLTWAQAASNCPPSLPQPPSVALTSRSETGTWSQKCPWSSASLRSAPGTGSPSW